MDEKTLTINVAKIYESSVGQSVDFKLSGTLDGDEEIKFISPVDLDVILTRIDDGLLANLTVQTEIELTCSRCAKQFRKKIKLTVEQAYDYEKNADLEFRIGKNMIIDFQSLVRDEIILKQPIKVLCKENCSGIERK